MQHVVRIAEEAALFLLTLHCSTHYSNAGIANTLQMHNKLKIAINATYVLPPIVNLTPVPLPVDVEAALPVPVPVPVLAVLTAVPVIPVVGFVVEPKPDVDVEDFVLFGVTTAAFVYDW
jgi:hypothetical protein